MLRQLDHNPALEHTLRTVTYELEPRCAPCHRARHRRDRKVARDQSQPAQALDTSGRVPAQSLRHFPDERDADDRRWHRPTRRDATWRCSTRRRDDATVDWDVAVAMRAGVHVRVNVFRPDDGDRHPVLLCSHPYGNDELPVHHQTKRGWATSEGEPAVFIKMVSLATAS